MKADEFRRYRGVASREWVDWAVGEAFRTGRFPLPLEAPWLVRWLPEGS